MTYNYKKIILSVVFALATQVDAATVPSGASIWYDMARVGNNPVNYAQAPSTFSRAEAAAISRDTVTFWNANEPNDSGGEDCAVQASNGGWNDLNCNNSRRVACFNGTNWAVTPNAVVMGANNNVNEVITNPINACQALAPAGSWHFAAPTTRPQRDALSAVISAAGIGNGAWINAQDMRFEGVWVINKDNPVMAPFWNAGEPNNSAATEHCAEALTNGLWNDIDCNAQRPLACFNPLDNQWRVTSDSVSFTDVNEMTRYCQTQWGDRYSFAAPITSAQQAQLQAQQQASNQSAVWINANDREQEGYWKKNLGLFQWAANEPQLSRGVCVQAQRGDALWRMADCDDQAWVLCSNGERWRLIESLHQFSNSAALACRRLEPGFRLATPVSEWDRAQVANLLATRPVGTRAWINLKYLSDVQQWLLNDDYQAPDVGGSNLISAVWYNLLQTNGRDFHNGPWRRYSDGANLNRDQALLANKGVRAYFAEGEPNDSGGCVQLYTSGGQAGLWDDTSCGNSKRVACFDGFDWAVSPTSVTLGPDSQFNEDVSNAHNACALVEKNGVQGNFQFAAPISFAQSRDLLAVANRSGANNVWINVNDKRYNRTFVYNLGLRVLAPFWNPGEPNNFAGNEDCAVQERVSGGWNDIHCNTVYPAACYHPELGANGTWRITSTQPAFTNLDDLSQLCQQQFGGPYKFYAPITLSQRDDLRNAMAAANVDFVYINASDQEYEGSWQYNQSVNNWDDGQPSAAATERCVSTSAATGRWQARACSTSLPVACTTGGRWYFTEQSTDLLNLANGQAACDTLGQGFLFAAPRTYDGAQQLKYYAALASVGGEYWINGNRLLSMQEWEWNRYQLDMPLWGDGQPAQGGHQRCAQMINDVRGSWVNQSCNAADDYRYLCRNGQQWQLSTIAGSLDSFSQATAACADLGAGWVFAAPTNYNENQAARNAMAGESRVWLNATDRIQRGSWVLNSAAISQYPNWAMGKPDNGGVAAEDETASLKGHDCVYQDANGQWSDANCLAADEYPWACTDGQVWRVTQAQHRIQSFAVGHKQCLAEFGSRFVFAAPLSLEDTIELDMARLLAEQERDQPIARVWLNVTDGGQEGEFRFNLPFSNWLMPSYPGEEPGAQCAYKSTTAEGSNNPWRTANCTQFAAHYACFDGASWRLATSQGALINGALQIVPQAGQDYWSAERGERLCKEQHGSSYYFAAPVTAVEELALDATIRNNSAQVKNTWINAYYVNEVTSNNNRWFVNRLALGVWQQPRFDNLNNADCALIHPDGSWTDAQCRQPYRFACFNGEWQLSPQSGAWEQGFAACQDNNLGLFAVPRTPTELNDLLAQMTGSDPVWINLTDTALESQWIANRLRYAWWSENEPSNIGNRDCAQIGLDGQWRAARCSLEPAAFACRRVQGANIEWFITEASSIWSHGFAACAREFPGSEFFAPVGYGQRSATMDQQVLHAAVVQANRKAWLNLSDQEVEGAWRSFQAFSDWGTASLLDDVNDCGYFDRVTAGRGTWYADRCRYQASEPLTRGYACHNDYEWRIVDATLSADLRWSQGFTACQSLGSEWRYAAPNNAVENAQLKLALELAGYAQAWINAQDRTEEGNWTINGPETNFAPDIDTKATPRHVNEQTVGVVLSALLQDDEEVGIAHAQWRLVADSRFANVADSDVVVSGTQLTVQANGVATATATFDAPRLLLQNAQLIFAMDATDIPPGTALAASATAFVTVTVNAPLMARYDFTDASQPQRDVSGNGFDALNTVAQPLPPVTSNALSLSENRVMVIPGGANGLTLPSTEYTVALRMSIEQPASGAWRGVLQKGDNGADRQPGLFLFPDSQSVHATNSTTVDFNRTANVMNVPEQQWLNVIYSKRSDGFDVYVDGDLLASTDFDSGETSVANNGNWYVGAIPGASESFTGLIDDIQLFSRLLSAQERAQILPAPPLGSVRFTESGSTVDEWTAAPNNVTDIVLERTRGSHAELTVWVDFDADNSTATLGTLADMVDASHPADVAFAASYVAGVGMPVMWPAGEKGTQSFRIVRDNADDGLREGTELARFRIVDGQGATVQTPDRFDLRLRDLTPNPYGNFSAVGPEPQVIWENDSAQYSLCVVRESGAQGDVTVFYNVFGDAQLGTHYTVVGGELDATGVQTTVQFADGDDSDKCVHITPILNASIGDPDRVLGLEITGLDHDTSIDPIQTAQNTAQLLIRDYAPGEFAFSATHYRCKEPNTDSTIPEELRPDASELLCELAVVRRQTGRFAPEASLIVNAPADPANYSVPSLLTWRAIDPSNPATSESETQFIAVNIVNDNVQEDDQSVLLTLLPTLADGHDENIVQSTAELIIEDVTSPALISLSVVQASINEGEQAQFVIQRSGNLNTAFAFDYVLNVEGKSSGKSNADYVDFVNGAAEQGVIHFAIGGTNQQTLVFNSINTLEPFPSVGLRLTLQNPTSPRTVGMGVLTNTNLDNAINRTDELVTVLNLKDRLEDNYQITLTDGSDTRSYTPGVNAAMPRYLVALQQHSPNRRGIDWSFSLPPKNTLDMDHSQIRYQWRLLNADGSAVATWFDGVQTQTDASDFVGSDTGLFDDGAGLFDYGVNAQLPTEAMTVSGSMRIPFVLDPTAFTLELTLEGGDGVTFPEVYRRQIEFVAQPYYRQLYNDGSCLNRAGKTNSCGFTANFWTWNESHRRLINRQSWLDNVSNICFQQSGSGVSMVNCTNTSNTEVTFPTVSGFNQLNVGSNAVCGRLWSNNLNQTSSPGGCTSAHRTWSWSAPLEIQ
ncbi:MAG: hypothetical protein IBX52_02375 [Bacterioplanes sp.]|nr:hypothetical protein [Bacterioplanes sp.]